MKNFLEVSIVRELYLHWNNLKYNFGKAIFPSLMEHPYMAVVDISNNSIGVVSTNLDSCITELCECLKINSTICHMDLSYNYFNFEASK